MCRLVRAIISHLVADCPPELDECERCRETQCTQGQWETCSRRLAVAAAVKTESNREG